VPLLEKSLAAIYRGVIEGRRSFGNMLSMAVVAAVLSFLPLLPAQMVLNNFFYDLSQLKHPHGERGSELGGPSRALVLTVTLICMLVVQVLKRRFYAASGWTA